MKLNKAKQLAIEKTAENARDECGVLEFGVQNIFESVQKTGYRVIRYPVGSGSLLGFAMVKEGERIIFSNSSEILSREYFSVAHELGHHKLHLKEYTKTIITDNDFTNRDEREAEANYFAACFLMPEEKMRKFIRLELKDKDIAKWNGFDIARIQTAFSSSYDAVLIRLQELNILINQVIKERLQLEKSEKTATKLLGAVNGNADLCKPAEVKQVPADYLEWVISNYNDGLIPKSSLETALKYVDINADDLGLLPEELDDLDNDIGIDQLLKGMD